MILIGQYDSPFVRRVAIALQHYGFAYEHRPWSVWADADRLAAYNPLRRVPVVVLDDGEVLVESSAILDALDEMVGPERALLPRTGPARRKGLRFSALATGLADKAVSLFYEGVLREEAVRSRVWVDRCSSQIRDTLDRLEIERAAIATDFWLGSFSHADVALACALRFIGEALPALLTDHRGEAAEQVHRREAAEQVHRREAPEQVTSRPALAAHAKRCEAMPVFQKIVQPLRVQISK
jgi:glutathione S-transferase